MKFITQKLILAGSLVLASVSMAEPFDGEKIMLCANQYASECVAGTDCTNVSPASVNLPEASTAAHETGTAGAFLFQA